VKFFTTKYVAILFSFLIATSVLISLLVLFMPKTNLNPHDNIIIESDGDFSKYGFSGEGSSKKPFIIENLNITTGETHGIYISTTTLHFEIRNCFVSAKDYGIYISETAEYAVIIEKNTIKYCNQVGLYCEESKGIIVQQNQFDKNNKAFSLRLCKESVFTNNKVTNSKDSSTIDLCSDSTITDNLFKNNEKQPLWLLWSWNSILSDNIFEKNSGGIFVQNPGTTIKNNKFDKWGIKLSHWTSEDFSTYVFENNTIQGKEIALLQNESNLCVSSEFSQIYLVKCENVTIYNKEIIETTNGITLVESRNITILNVNLNKNGDSLNIFDCDNVNIINSTISNSSSAIILDTCPNSVITSCNIINNVEGIWMYNSDNFTFVENTLSNNKIRGLELAYTYNCTVRSNNFTWNGIEILGGYTYTDSDKLFLDNNLVNGLPIGIFTNETELNITSKYGQIITKDCNSVSISNQTIFGVQRGIQIFGGENHTIQNNEFWNCSKFGLVVSGCKNAILENNLAKFCGDGIWISDMKNVTIQNNELYGNYNSGICQFTSNSSMIKDNYCIENEVGIINYSSKNWNVTNNTLYQNAEGFRNEEHIGTQGENFYKELSFNQISNNKIGVKLWDSREISVKNNEIIANNEIGIFVWESFNCSIKQNKIDLNGFGIKINVSESIIIYQNQFIGNSNYALVIYLDSFDNTIYSNNFISNKLEGISQAYDDSTNSTWFNLLTSTGNYWENWQGNGSYFIDGESKSEDPYPIDHPVILF